MSSASNCNIAIKDDSSIDKKPCVVLIDDHLQSRLIGQKHLKNDGFDVIQYGSGIEFLDDLPSLQLDIILLDVMMPEISGYTVCQMVRKDPRFINIPILMLTGLDDMASIAEAYDVGATDFVTKPINWTILHQRIRYMLRASDVLHRLESTISDLKEAEHQIWCKAYFDGLTSLPNRQYLIESVEKAIIKANSRHEQFVFIIIEFQRFRNINQNFGHLMGDYILQSISQRLKSLLSAEDDVFLARFGSDQFALILTRNRRQEDVESFMQQMTTALHEPYFYQQNEFRINANIGICNFPADGDNVDELIKHAQISLQYSKNQGVKNYFFYNADLSAKALRRVQVEHHLRTALSNNEFIVYYQPKLDLKLNQIIGAEALLRWQNPILGSVSPVEFISVAEETGLISEIGVWVLQKVCRDVKQWLPNHSTFNVAVNISAIQFYQSNLIEQILNVLDVTEFPAANLEIEITESAVMQDIKNTTAQLLKLLSYGICTSMDDFGTGYSSLNYLKCLPIKKLKIDKSFISDVCNNPESEAIVKAIIAMAHNLNLQVIAEGVETDEIRQFLQNQGCDQIQGYLISKPVPADEFTKLIN